MSERQETETPTPLFRINHFTVPARSRAEFIDILARTRAVLRRQAGFVRDFLLERRPAPDTHSIVFLVELAGPHAIEPITAAVARHDRKTGLDRKAAIARLGVTAEFGIYQPLDIRVASPKYDPL